MALAGTSRRASSRRASQAASSSECRCERPPCQREGSGPVDPVGMKASRMAAFYGGGRPPRKRLASHRELERPAPATYALWRMKTFEPRSTESFLTLARSWAATVTVVTARRAEEHVRDGAPALDGFTATAFLTISMSPPIIAVSATVANSAAAMLRESSAFAVSLLSPSQSELAVAVRATGRGALRLVGARALPPRRRGRAAARRGRGRLLGAREAAGGGRRPRAGPGRRDRHPPGEVDETLVYSNRAYGRVSRLA